MSRQPIDLTGKRFGRLVAIWQLERKRGSTYYWLCRCDCGEQKEIPSRNLRMRNGTRSCGCLHREISRKNGIARQGKHFRQPYDYEAVVEHNIEDDFE